MKSFSKLMLCFMLVLPLLGASCTTKLSPKPEVIASGVGTSLQEAKNDAIRQGIQYLVGSYVTSDIESSNGTITKDNVTDYAGAIVDRFEILNQKRRADGLYEMKARIRIAGDAGRQRNRSAIAKPGRIDGQSLEAEALSRFELQNNITQLWENALTGYPGRAFSYAVMNPSITTIPGNTDIVTLAFYTAAFLRADFLTEFQTLLKTTGRALNVSRNIPYEAYWNNGSRDDIQTGICLKKGFRKPESDFACYVIDIPSERFKKWLCQKSYLNFVVELLGSDNTVFRYENGTASGILPYVEHDYNGMTAIFIFYIVDNEMIQDRSDYQERISAPWKVNVPVNSLPTIKTIRARAECS